MHLTHCVYHFPCFDGFTAAYAVWNEYGDRVEYIPKNYGDDLPDLPEDAHVLIVDVSWPREELIDLNNRVASLVVLDHHKTAQDALSGLDFATFDMDRSGAGITWDWLHGKGNRPLLIDYVEDRDLWRFKYGEPTKRTHAYLSSLPWDFVEWEMVHHALENHPQRVLVPGQSIRRYQEKRYGEVADLMHMVYIGSPVTGYTLPAANIGLAAFKSGGIHAFLEQNPEVKVAGAYAQGPDGKWYWSLRSVEGFDCSEIAKEFDGGGHPQASGFTTSFPPNYLGEVEEWLES